MWLLFLLHLQRTALCIYPGKAIEGSVTRNSKQGYWERREMRDLKKCRRFISAGNAMCVCGRENTCWVGCSHPIWCCSVKLLQLWMASIPHLLISLERRHVDSSGGSVSRQPHWSASETEAFTYGELGARYSVGRVPLTLGLEFSFLRQGLTCVVVAVLELMM